MDIHYSFLHLSSHRNEHNPTVFLHQRNVNLLLNAADWKPVDDVRQIQSEKDLSTYASNQTRLDFLTTLLR